MTTRAQFCPIAKAAEVFGDRRTPIIIRELRDAIGFDPSSRRKFSLPGLKPSGATTRNSWMHVAASCRLNRATSN
jgi:hypothetical protein